MIDDGRATVRMQRQICENTFISQKVCPSIVRQEKTVKDFTAIPHISSTSQDDGLQDMPDTDQDINPVDAKKPADKTLARNFSSSPGSAKC